MKVVNAEPIPIVSSLLSMSTKPTNPQRLDNSTIQRVLDDKELSGLLDEKVRDAGVHTSIGYSAVLRQFLASNEVSTKIKEWQDEKEKDDDTASTAATSWVGGLASSFTNRLTLFDDEPVDPNTISPLTAKSTYLSPVSRSRAAYSDYGPTRTPKSTTSTNVSPSRTFPSLPYTSQRDGFNDSPTFRKQLVEFMAPRNPFGNFNLHLKDEAVKPKKQIPDSHRNLQSGRRTSMKQANIAASLQHLDQSLYANSEDELSQDGDLKFEESFQCSTP